MHFIREETLKLFVLQRIFPNTQPAIIDEQVFARVQELRENKRRPAKQAERQGLFSGLL